MKIAARLFAVVYRAVSALLVASAAAVLLLLIFGVRPYAVVTGSMEPTIPQGSVCFVSGRANFDDVSEGDIVVYRLGSLLVTHRAVSIDERGIATKGDANNTEDTGGRVMKDNFIGKVVFWVPLVGKALMYSRSVKGRAVVIGAFVLFLAAGVLYDRLSARKEYISR